MIEELVSFTPADVRDLDRLMHELSDTSFCDERRLGEMVRDENCHLYVVRQAQEPSARQEKRQNHRQDSGAGQEMPGRIVGCACLCVGHSPEFTLGFVEAVTVLSECRGQHLGRRLMEYVLTEAERLGVERVHLTSSLHRVAANGLYRALGFRLKDTNCYEFRVERK